MFLLLALALLSTISYADDQFPLDENDPEGFKLLYKFSLGARHCNNVEPMWYNVGNNDYDVKTDLYDTMKITKLMFRVPASGDQPGENDQMAVVTVPESARTGQSMTMVEWLREVFGLGLTDQFPQKTVDDKWDSNKAPGYHQALEWINRTSWFTGTKLKIGVGDGTVSLDGDWQLFAFTDDVNTNYKTSNIFNLGGEYHCGNAHRDLTMLMYGQMATENNQLRSMSVKILLDSPMEMQAKTCAEHDELLAASLATMFDFQAKDIYTSPGDGCLNLDRRVENGGDANHPDAPYVTGSVPPGQWRTTVTFNGEYKYLKVVMSGLMDPGWPARLQSQMDTAAGLTSSHFSKANSISPSSFKVGAPVNPCANNPCFGNDEWESVCEYTPTNLVTRYKCGCANSAYTYFDNFGCTNHMPAYWAVRGGGHSGYCDVNQECSPRTTDATGGHYVRCCTDTAQTTNGVAWVHNNQVSECIDIYSASNAWKEGCLGQVNWWVADRFCKDQNARLCSYDEVTNGCAKGAGCGYDNEVIWTSLGVSVKVEHKPFQIAEGGYYYIAQGDHNAQCIERSTKPCHTMAVSVNENHAFRCCSVHPADGWTKSCERGDEAVWVSSNKWQTAQGTTDAGCRGLVTWDVANRFCRKQGGQICSLSEVSSGCTKGTGCDYDGRSIWTSTAAGGTSKPSPAPTYSAARIPDQTHHRIVWGSGKRVPATCTNADGICETRSAVNRDLYGVRCCSEQPRGWWTDELCPNEIWSSSKSWFTVADGCKMMNWYEADEFCDNQGGRLCYVDELERSCSANTGCGYNDHMVWAKDTGSATECPNPKLYCHCSYDQNLRIINNLSGGCDTCQCIDNPLVPDSHTIAKGSQTPACDHPDGCASRPAFNTEEFGIRCCDDFEPKGKFPRWVQRCTGVFSESDGIDGSCHTMSWSEGAKFCYDHGHRLCTLWEIENDCAMGTGCHFDSKMVWTSDGPITVTDPPTTTEPFIPTLEGDACDIRDKVLETFNSGFTAHWIGCADVPPSYCIDVRRTGSLDPECRVIAGSCMNA